MVISTIQKFVYIITHPNEKRVMSKTVSQTKAGLWMIFSQSTGRLSLRGYRPSTDDGGERLAILLLDAFNRHYFKTVV